MTELLTTAQKLINQSSIKPEQVTYSKDGFVSLDGQPFKVDRPRLAFAMVLALFEEPELSDIVVMAKKGMSSTEYPKFGKHTIIGGNGFGYERDENGIPFRIKSLGNVIIGKHVEIGSNTCIDRGTVGPTIIGDYVKIDNLIHIAHNAKIGNKTMIAAGAVICGSVEIGESCFIGVNSSIKQKVKVGNNCMIGMGAIVLKDVPDNTTVVGIWK